MKIAKAFLVVLSLLAVGGTVLAQPATIFFMYLPQNHAGENNDPLHFPCGAGGTPFPMGVNVTLWEDENGNGPDPVDVQPNIGGGEREVSANTWPMNSGDGYFFTDPALVVGSVPEAGVRYYLEVNSSGVCWHSVVFLVTPGMTVDTVLDDSQWTCATGPCAHGGAVPNPATNFSISDTIGCLSLTAQWVHDGQNVTTFTVYRQPNIFVASAAGNQRMAQFEVSTTDTFTYFVRAANGVGESANSNTDNGASYRVRFASGANGRLCGVQPVGATFTIHFEVAAPQCPSGLELWLEERRTGNLRLLCRDSLVTQMTCRLPNQGLDSCRLVLVDSAFNRNYEDTIRATCWFWNPLSAVGALGNLTPDRFELGQNYPNPFNPITDIAFSVPFESEVRIEIYNISGQLVRTLVSGNYPVGVHHATWDGLSDNGFMVGTGLYLYRMTAPGFIQTNKMLLIK